VLDIWFHRYKDGVDIEGRFDYNSWQESETGRRLANSLDRDTVLAEGKLEPYGRMSVYGTDGTPGYKQYDTQRVYMAKMGNWREDRNLEIPLDGIGGVNILVKADVHRSGTNSNSQLYHFEEFVLMNVSRHQLPLLRLRKPSRNRRLRQNGQTRRLRRLRPSQLCRLAHRHGGETRQCIDLGGSKNC
jgi:hypothetical protein